MILLNTRVKLGNINCRIPRYYRLVIIFFNNRSNVLWLSIKLVNNSPLLELSKILHLLPSRKSTSQKLRRLLCAHVSNFTTLVAYKNAEKIRLQKLNRLGITKSQYQNSNTYSPRHDLTKRKEMPQRIWAIGVPTT